MAHKSFHDLVRTFDGMTDAQLASMALPDEGLEFITPAIIETRFMGRTKLLPGPPSGVIKRPDGSYTLTNVAVIRVHPESSIVAAKKLVDGATTRGIIIGMASGAVSAVIAFGGMYLWQHRTIAPAAPVTSPCLVTSISAQAVSCRVASTRVAIRPGGVFPGGAYQLDAIDKEKSSFTATRIVDRQRAVFQHAFPNHKSPKEN